jgi:hypothetical protein
MSRTFQLPLIAGAAAGLVGVLILPSLVGTEAEQLNAIREAGARYLTGNTLTFIATALVGIGLAILGARLLRDGHTKTGVLAAIAGGGWLAHTALIAHNAVMYEVAQMADHTAAAELAESVFAGPVFLAILLPMLLASLLGTIALAIALTRIGAAPVWAAVAIVAGLISDLIMPEGTVPSGSPMFLLLLVGFIGVAGTQQQPAVHATV